MISGRISIAVCACLAVSACGGGGGGGDNEERRVTTALRVTSEPLPAVADPQRALSLSGESVELSEEFTAGEEIVPTSNLDGRATYTGVATFVRGGLDSGIAALGRLTLDADFDSREISGDISDFASSSEQFRVSGELDVVNGEILSGADDGRFDADLEGDLNVNGSNRQVTGGMEGIFTGNDAQAVAGSVNVDPIDGLSDDSTEGFFVATDRFR